MRLLVIAILMAGQAFAQTTTTTTSTFLSNLSMDVDAFTETVRDDEDSVQDLKTWADFNTYYQLTANDRLTLRNSFYYRTELLEKPFDFEQVELHYRRKNILTQDKHGVNVQADIRGAYIVNNDSRLAKQSQGGVHGRVYVNRQVTPQFSFTGKARYDFFLKYKSNPGTYSNLLLLDASAEYAFNDTWGTALFTEYTNLIPSDSTVSQNRVAVKVEPSVKYNVSGTTFVKGYTGIVPVENNDNEGWKQDSFKQAYFGVEFFSRFM